MTDNDARFSKKSVLKELMKCDNKAIVEGERRSLMHKFQDHDRHQIRI